MASAQYVKSLTIAGVTFSKSPSNIEADGNNAFTASLTAAKTLSSWVKTDADTAAGDLAGGHGWSTGVYDVYWDGGRRYDVDVTITTNACALDGGSGDDFPASGNTTVVLSPREELTGFALDGDNAKIVAVAHQSTDLLVTSKGMVRFYDADDNLIAAVDLDCNGDPNINDIYSGEVNRYTGDVIVYGIGSTAYTGASTVKAAVGYLFDT
jgi:hypothetical protein